MNVLMYVFNHWSDILVIIVVTIALFMLTRQWIMTTARSLDGATANEKLSWLSRLLSNLIPIALVLVTDAEIEYGDGTGPLKRATVIAQLYDYIPDDFKQFVTEAQLARIVELALAEARELWTDHVAIGQLIKPSE